MFETAKKIQEHVGVYAFENLDEDSQYRVIAWHEECCLIDDMNCILEMDVDSVFPNSTIEAQYDFSACQGSGLNLYGTFSYNDLRKFAGYKPLAEDFEIKIPYNRFGTYCTWNGRGTLYEINSAIDEFYTSNYSVQMATMQLKNQWPVVDAICTKMADLCSNLYDMGEKQIEHYGSAEFNEEFLFEENGEFHGYAWDEKPLPVFDSLEPDTDNDEFLALNFELVNLFGDIVENAHFGGLEFRPITPAVTNVYEHNHAKPVFVGSITAKNDDDFNQALADIVAKHCKEAF